MMRGEIEETQGKGIIHKDGRNERGECKRKEEGKGKVQEK